MFDNRITPTMAINTHCCLVLPFKEMNEYLVEIAADRVVLADTQIVELLCERVRINLVPLPCFDERDSSLNPLEEIVLIECAVRQTIAAHRGEIHYDITYRFTYFLLILRRTRDVDTPSISLKRQCSQGRCHITASVE